MTKPTPTEIASLRDENKTLRMLIRAAVLWDRDLERDTPKEDLVIPEWRREACAVLGIPIPDEIERR